MPEVTLEPFEEPTNTRRLDPVAPVGNNTRVLPSVEITPDPVFRPELDDTIPTGQALQRVQAHPDFFNDIGRVADTMMVEETRETGLTALEPGRQLGIDPNTGQYDPDLEAFDRMMTGSFEPTPPRQRGVLGTIGHELGGIAETIIGGGSQVAINLFEHGYTSIYSMFRALDREDMGYAEAYVSEQGKTAAAYGRFYDYDPINSAAERNMEAIGQGFHWLAQGIEWVGESFGDATLEATDSPALATVARMVPDAVLMALPFTPKAVRGARERRAAREIDEAAVKDAAGPAGEAGMVLKVADEADTIVNGQPSGPQVLRVSVETPEGLSFGSLTAYNRGGSLQIVDANLSSELIGRGIGSQMYETMIQAARSRGHKSLGSDTVVSESAAAVYDRLRANGARVERNRTAELENGKWESGDGRPVYQVVIDEPAATSSLHATKMKVETLTSLVDDTQRLTPEAASALANDIKAGRAAAEIIVETVEGSPVGILSGAEYLQAIGMAAEKAGFTIRNLTVKLQERQALSAADEASLSAQARAGLSDITANQRRLDAVEGQQTRSTWQKIVHMFGDTSGNVKAEILKTMGEIGQEAIQAFSLKAGAVPKAHLMFQDFHRAVFGRRGLDDPGLDFGRSVTHLGEKMSEVELFNVLVQSRRTQAIVKSGGARPKEGGFQLEGAVKPENAAGNIWAIRQTLGESRFAQLQSRADVVFETMHNQLMRLRENGIITQAQFLKMQNIDYVTRRFLDVVDPTMLVPGHVGTKLSVGESGIYRLKGGSKKAQDIDVQSLVAEYLARTESRIFRNNANKALYNAARAEPENGLVRVPETPNKKVPEGYSELKVMIDGEPQRMFMKDLYATEWVLNDPGMAMAISNFFRVVNGTFVVKPLATGINPAFAVVNFPRDIMHAWKATGNQFSTFLPVYLGQIFTDMWQMRKDVWNKDGAYRDYINEGGGMSFLTHGGFDPLTGFNKQKDLLRAVGVHRGQFGRSWAEAKEVLSKVNEFSELLVRLAIRNRVIKNDLAMGKIPDTQRATFIARDYLDFSQGGSVTKAMEGLFPYTNAASQAIRTAYREYLRGGDAARTAALKDLQILTMKAGVSGWSWMENPEAMAQLDSHTAMTNFVFPTGLSYTDDRNNRRHLVIPVAMDTSILPFTAGFDALIQKHALLATGIDPMFIPSDHLLGHIAGAIPIIGAAGAGTPTFQAYTALTANKDLWLNRDIWNGDPFARPGVRRSAATEGTAFDVLGSAFPDVVSPLQLQKAWRTYIPSNFYFDSADFLRRQVQRAGDPVARAEALQRELSDVTLEIMSQVPGLNRLVHVTHPAAQTTPELREIASHVATWYEIERQAIDRAVRKYMALGDSGDFANLLERVAQARPQDADRVRDLLVTKVVTAEMYRQNTYDIGFVGEDWFNTLAGQNPETRAELYYWKHATLSDENARNLDAVIAQIDRVGGRRIRTEGFQQQLAQLVAQFGTREERLRIRDDGR